MTIINDRFGEVTDVLGVGIGPFNLSLAALLSPIKTLKFHFFDQAEQFAWHPGMLLPNSEIQVSYLKDLVTLVDPTNPFSFLSFLTQQKRLYRFINARFPRVQRSEFNQYLKWVSESLPNMHFREKVENIEFSDCSKLFTMQTSRRLIKSKHIVLGHGLSPYIPEVIKPFIGETVFHNKDFVFKKPNYANKRVIIIGGGQSGAEIMNALLSEANALPSKITWISRRQQFQPIDDSPGANELFTPEHSEAFYQLNPSDKASLFKQHVLASDGISEYLLESIYQKLYQLEYLEGQGRFYDLLPNHSLLSMHKSQAHYDLSILNHHNNTMLSLDADIIILCTGYQSYLPSYLSSLMSKIAFNNEKLIINNDYSIQWDGPTENRIYMQNSASHSHGIADPNLSLMAYRSAKIVNSIAEKSIYDLSGNHDCINWKEVYHSNIEYSDEETSYAKHYY